MGGAGADGRYDFLCRGESRRGLRDHCDVKLERCGVGKLDHEESCVWRGGGGGGGGTLPA